MVDVTAAMANMTIIGVVCCLACLTKMESLTVAMADVATVVMLYRLACGVRSDYVAEFARLVSAMIAASVASSIGVMSLIDCCICFVMNPGDFK